jgi:hypothetical protein
MANLNSWNFTEKHVEPDILGYPDATNRNYISSESIVICAAPAVIDTEEALAENLFPIGVIESAGLAQNKQVQQLFEIGSRKPYYIPGRTRVNVGLSRVVFNGNSLMAQLYRSGGLASDEYEPNDSPGYIGNVNEQNNFYFNLASSFFNKPFGLVFVMQDSEKEYAAMIYLENCMITAQTMNIGANQTIVMENINLISEGIQPIRLATDPG